MAVGHVEYQRRPEVASHPVRLAARPVLLAGREGLLADIDTRMNHGQPDGDPVAPAGPRVVVLCGLGGAGKTSVAVEYAHRHLAEVGVAWQFPSDDRALLVAEFGELAAQLGARDLLDIRDPVASVHGVLAAAGAEWLLLFDNAPDRASVEPFIPPAGRGRVLITSQSQLWPASQALDVPVLDRDVAAGFLLNRAGDQDRQAALELADEVGGLPLALEQAAAYVRATGDRLASYLASFRQRRDDMLARGEPAGYSKTVATTWSLAFEQLRMVQPEAVALLRLLANCAPEAIPLALLLRRPEALDDHMDELDELDEEVVAALTPLVDDPLTAKDAIAALRRYSLVSPAGDDLVSVHRLVQAVTLQQMPAALAAEWRRAAAILIESAIPVDTEPLETWPIFALLLPHAQATLDYHRAGMRFIALYHSRRSSYAAARDVWQRIYDANRDYSGPDSPDTLDTRDNLAWWTGEAGDAVAARDQYEALLADVERVLGPDHEDTLHVRDCLAYWTGLAGDAAAARDQYAALLADVERTLGPDHPTTLDVRGSLAEWVSDAGDSATEGDLLAALLADRRRVLGPDHPDTLESRFDLAWWTGEFGGDAAQACDQLSALLADYERVLGRYHASTFNARHGLAWWTGEAGDAAAAREAFTSLLADREMVQGLDHRRTLDTRHSLAYWTGLAGDPAAARDQFAALTADLERIFGPQHPSTIRARDSLADWTERVGLAGGG